MGGEVVGWAIVGVFVVLIVLVLLLGIFYPGTGAEQLRWRPTRSPELEAENEIDDMTQMLDATNAKRRARGLGPLTEQELHARVHEDAPLRRRLRRSEEAEIAEERRQHAQAREWRRHRREGRER
jgi:hypothetical protein